MRKKEKRDGSPLSVLEFPYEESRDIATIVVVGFKQQKLIVSLFCRLKSEIKVSTGPQGSF